MNKVRYILGAGFSAPLGLPTRAALLERAKDMIFRQPERYERHQALIREFDQVAKVGVYCQTDPLDFEEVMGIIEMENFAKARRTKKPFVDLLQDTIEHYSRALDKIEGPTGSDWVAQPFGALRRLNLYGVFLASLFSLTLRRTEQTGELAEGSVAYEAQSDAARSDYGVVTTNFDLVLERFLEALTNHYRCDEDVRFARPVIDEDFDPEMPGVPMVKLHGSIDSDIVIPPTWARSTHRKAAQLWEQGLARLSEANHIRIIGHALAPGDLHLRYLLKAAVLAAPHLKTIDAICLDPDGSVAKRYDSFFPYRNLRFVNADVVSYLRFITEWTQKQNGESESLAATRLEEAHEEFMVRAVVSRKA